jgi:hypothetical protein
MADIIKPAHNFVAIGEVRLIPVSSADEFATTGKKT